MTKPFAGIRILDFTRYLAGPFGTYQFALLGAEVIKIEPKAGDDMRHSQFSKKWAEKAMGPSFMGINANKRSLTLDLQKPAAVAIVKRLAETADIVWGEFPALGSWRWRSGLGYEVLTRDQPAADLLRRLRLRPGGAERGTAAFDGKLQAMRAGSCRSPATRTKARPAPGPRCATRSAG